MITQQQGDLILLKTTLNAAWVDQIVICPIVAEGEDHA